MAAPAAALGPPAPDGEWPRGSSSRSRPSRRPSSARGCCGEEERKTAEQKRIAEENYELARNLSRSGFELIAKSEAEFAADPAKRTGAKELLVAAAKAFQSH